MAVGIFKEVMPHVRFENKDYGRNEEASRRAGRHIPNNAVFIIIHPHGSRDESEHLAEEWIPRKRMEASRGIFPEEWIDKIERIYEAWKKGHELPREGTPVHTWQMASPEQRSRLVALGLTTVEDLSAIPDSGLGEIGLDARNLRDMARAWIAEGQQKGINAQELASAQQKLRDMEAKLAQRDQVIEDLRNRMEALEDKPRRRKPAEEAA